MTRSLLACFGRAFDVAQQTKTASTRQVRELAKDWISYIKNLPTPAAELDLGAEMAQ